MFGYTLIKESDLREYEEIRRNLKEELSKWMTAHELVFNDLEMANKTIAKLQTHLREAKETAIAHELTNRELLLSKEVKQVAYAIFHQYATRAMDRSVIKKEEKTYQNVYKCYIQHLKNLLSTPGGAE